MGGLQVRTGVLVDGDGEVLVAVDVVEHGGDGGGVPGEEQVVGVGTTYAGAEHHAGAASYVDVADAQRVVLRVDRGVRARVPPRHVERCRRLGRRRQSRRRHLVEVANGAVEPVPQLGRHVVDLVQQRRGTRVGAPHLALLLLRERHRAEAEQLVDLEGVHERALALRRELGVVVEDDRRAQHHALLVLRAGEHREDPLVRARRHEALGPLGVVELGDEGGTLDLEQRRDRPRGRGAATAAGRHRGHRRTGCGSPRARTPARRGTGRRAPRPRSRCRGSAAPAHAPAGHPRPPRPRSLRGSRR